MLDLEGFSVNCIIRESVTRSLAMPTRWAPWVLGFLQEVTGDAAGDVQRTAGGKQCSSAARDV